MTSRETTPEARALSHSAAGPDDPADPMLATVEADAAQLEEGQIRSGRLAGKSLRESIWILAMPVLLQQLMIACVGLVDKMIAGNLPGPIVVPALDGIGIGTYVGWFTGIAFAGLGAGGQAIIARAIGAGDTRDAHGALAQSVVLGTLWGAGVGLCMAALAHPLAWIAGLSPEAEAHCTTYVTTIAWSMPFCGLMNIGSMCMHGAGETARPSWISIAVNVVNLVASWLLSGVDLRLGGLVLPNPVPLDPMEWGVWGIAAGTALSYVVGGLATLVELALPLVRVDGLLLAIKGEKAAEAIAAAQRALKELPGEVAATHRTPTGTIVAIHKLAKTVRLYPRDQGLPARKPLGVKPAEGVE